MAGAILVACDINSASANNQCLKNTFKTASEASDFWTPERRAAAEPVEMPELPENLREGLEIESRYPSAITEENPYAADVGRAPFQAGGRLLFVKSDGKAARCTAEFSGAGNILLTAAHCVVDPKTGKWNSNFYFERAYKKGSAQIYQVSEMTVRSEWRDSGKADPRFDYAFLVAGPNYRNPLTLYFGAVPSRLTSFGYPGNYGAGKVMYAADGYRAAQGHGLVLMGDNPMKHGSSGGAWVTRGKGDEPETTVYGLNSHGDKAISNAVWSPAFDATTKSLFEYAMTLPCSD